MFKPLGTIAQRLFVFRLVLSIGFLKANRRWKEVIDSLYKRPALAILIVKTHIGLAESVEPLQFSPAKPVAYKGSQDQFRNELILTIE